MDEIKIGTLVERLNNIGYVSSINNDLYTLVRGQKVIGKFFKEDLLKITSERHFHVGDKVVVIASPGSTNLSGFVGFVFLVKVINNNYFYYVRFNNGEEHPFSWNEIDNFNNLLDEDNYINNTDFTKPISENELKNIIKNNKLSKDNWYDISVYQKLSEEFIKEFQDKVGWIYISKHQKLSEEFIKKFQDKVDWDYISVYQKLSEKFIKEFQDKVNWSYISASQKLSENFIKEFQNKKDYEIYHKEEDKKISCKGLIIDYQYNFEPNSPAKIELKIKLQDGSIKHIKYNKILEKNLVINKQIINITGIIKDDYILADKIEFLENELIETNCVIENKKGVSGIMKNIIKSELLKDRLHKAGLRVAGRNITRGMQTAITSALKSKGFDDGMIGTVSKFLETDIGQGFISSLLGVVIPQVPVVGTDRRAQALAEEFQVEGLSVMGDSLIKESIGLITPILTNALKDIPELPEHIDVDSSVLENSNTKVYAK
jgi:hypothetical protein